MNRDRNRLGAPVTTCATSASDSLYSSVVVYNTDITEQLNALTGQQVYPLVMLSIQNYLSKINVEVTSKESAIDRRSQRAYPLMGISSTSSRSGVPAEWNRDRK